METSDKEVSYGRCRKLLDANSPIPTKKRHSPYMISVTPSRHDMARRLADSTQWPIRPPTTKADNNGHRHLRDDAVPG